MGVVFGFLSRCHAGDVIPAEARLGAFVGTVPRDAVADAKNAEGFGRSGSEFEPLMGVELGLVLGATADKAEHQA